MNHVYEEIPPVVLEFDFKLVELMIPTLRNHQILSIKNCPSLTNALSKIKLLVAGFLVKFVSALCLCFTINDEVDRLTEIEFHEFFECFKGYSRSFLIIFKSMVNNHWMMYWRLKDTQQVFSLNLTENLPELGNFVMQFLFQSLKNGHSGKY